MADPKHGVVYSQREGHSIATDAATSARMADIRQYATAPELVVRALMTRLGLRYRLKNRDLPGSPDLAHRGQRWVVFVHGCYWHRHQGCRRTTTPKRNRDFWQAKFERNLARDARVTDELEAMGYRVIVVWECQTKQPEALLETLRAAIVGAGRCAAPAES